MMGLLDPTDDPRTMGLLSLGMGLLGSKGSFGNALSQAGPQALQAMQVVKEREARKKQQEQAQAMQQLQMDRAYQMQQLQMQQAQMAIAQQQAAQQRQQAVEGAYRGALRSPEQMAMAGGGGPSPTNAAAIPNTMPGVDNAALVRGLMQADPMAAYQMLQPKPADYKVVGDALVAVGPAGVKEAYRAPAKPLAPPAAIQEYEYAKGQGYQGSFEQWDTARKRAGATNVTVPVNTAKPLLNTIAEGLGKNIDASLSNAQAAIPAIQTAQTLKQSVDSGKLIAGPGSTFRVLGLQVGQMLGVGGKDGAEVLSNTRTAIQSMAKAELDAAAQMKGQGQITEAERGIIKRAAAGDIDSLTAPEIRLLAEGMEKTARFKIKQHQANVQRLGQMPGAAPILPFYSVDEPAAYSGQSGAVRKFNPATGRIE